MAAEILVRKLAAIVSADVVGYSRLMGLDEAGTLLRLNALRNELIGPKIVAYRGRVVKLMGDGILVEFTSVVDALACTVEVQREIGNRNTDVPEDERIVFRFGINLGDIIVQGDDIYGDGVNISARLEALAAPGGICISQAARDAVGTKLPLRYEFLGERRTKNIAEPVKVHQVLLGVGETATSERHRRAASTWTRWAAIATGLGVIAAMAGVVSYERYRELVREPAPELALPPAPGIPADPPAGKPSIAVLPFTNISNDPAQEYFADGITEDLTTDLSKVSGLFVISRNSAFTYKGKVVIPTQVARELGVRYVLEGSVRRAGEKVRINAQLIDSTTGGHLWADRYDRDYADIFALQDEVMGKIVAALAVKLTDSEHAQLERKPTDNLEAYDYYLRARRGAYSDDGRGLAEALVLYQKAVTLDPKFADAYAGYARAAVDVWRLDVDWVLPGPVAHKNAYQAVAQALELDPGNPGAYSVLGVLQMVDRRYDEAIESVGKAVTLAPNSAEAHANLALVLAHAGKPAEAVATMEIAFRLNPRPSAGFNLLSGLVFFMDRQYEHALERLKAAREAMPTNDAVHEQLAMTYARLGRSDEARAEVREMLERRPWLNLTYLRLARGYHRRVEDLDHRAEALREAGMPQWPFDFQGRVQDRLDGETIRKMTSGRTWWGHGIDGMPFVKQFSENQTVAFRDPSHYLSGSASIKEDMLCQQYPAFLMGREYCSYLYRNPGGRPEEHNEYIIVTVFHLAYFSVAQ